jgi:hypothetical protein
VRGATLGYEEIEAEDASYQATLIGPGREYAKRKIKKSPKKLLYNNNNADTVPSLLKLVADRLFNCLVQVCYGFFFHMSRKCCVLLTHKMFRKLCRVHPYPDLQCNCSSI